MGHNLALKMERNGFPVTGYDLDSAKTKAFGEGPAAGKNVIGVDSPSALMAVLEKPRRILMMVPAGTPVECAIEHLKPYKEPRDILMGGGNSFFLQKPQNLDDPHRNRTYNLLIKSQLLCQIELAGQAS